ncbi:MAG: hypothetical protein JNL67_03595 [Planctomycetaceae bacterium]|nr:hypothetical protein [Planctomycetaceae bacterium]
MVKRYRHNRIQFAYPDNWELQPPEQAELPHEISVESPEGCLWMVTIFSATNDPKKLFSEALQSFSDNYQDFEYEAIKATGELKPEKSVQAHFFCLDFLITAKIQIFVQRPFVYLIVQQAENRLYERSEAVFEAITASLLGNSNPVEQPE